MSSSPSKPPDETTTHYSSMGSNTGEESLYMTEVMASPEKGLLTQATGSMEVIEAIGTAEIVEALPSSSPIATSPPQLWSSTPELSHQALSPEPPPWRQPTSNDLAFLASLPIPTVYQPTDPRYDFTTHVNPQYYSDELSNPSTRPQEIDPSINTTFNQWNSASSFSPPVYPPGQFNYHQGNNFDDSSQVPVYPLHPGTILGAGSRQWQGISNQNVRMYRRDTWIVGQRWGRHLRVFEGVRQPNPDESSTYNTATTVPDLSNTPPAMSRNRTW
jgi:hypothetical protein